MASISSRAARLRAREIVEVVTLLQDGFGNERKVASALHIFVFVVVGYRKPPCLDLFDVVAVECYRLTAEQTSMFHDMQCTHPSLRTVGVLVLVACTRMQQHRSLLQCTGTRLRSHVPVRNPSEFWARLAPKSEVDSYILIISCSVGAKVGVYGT